MPTEQRSARGARERLLSAALDLFARHGVNGTSLQMIADQLGVTKAAVYHQFQTKEDIVLAVIAPAMTQLGVVVGQAEARPTPASRRDAMLSGLVDLVVDHRRLAAVIQADPAVSHLVRQPPALGVLGERIDLLLTGPDPDDETRVNAAMVGGGLMIAGVDPHLKGMDDDTLRRHLLSTARRTLRLRAPAPRGTT
jgi:AcrR family transcriptional regulator